MKKAFLLVILLALLYLGFEVSVVLLRDYYCTYKAEQAEIKLGKELRPLTEKEKKIYAPEIVTTSPYFTVRMACKSQLYVFSPIFNYVNSHRP